MESSIKYVLNHITFGKTNYFIVQTIIGTILVFISFIYGIDELIIYILNLVSSKILVVILLNIFVLSSFLLYYMLSMLGFMTFSPRFHRPRKIFFSLILYQVISLVLGLIIFIGITQKPKYPNGKDSIGFLFGLNLGLIYVILLAYTHINAIKFFTNIDPDEKKQLINNFLDLSTKLNKCDYNEVEEIGDNLIEVMNKISGKLSSETTEDTKYLHNKINDCLNDFENSSPGNYKKIICNVSETYNNCNKKNLNMSSYWKEKNKRFKKIYCNLKLLNNSAFNNVHKYR